MNASIWPNAPAQEGANWNGGVAPTQETPAVAKTPPAAKKYARMPLRNLADVRLAMATVIRESRSGRLDIADGSRLCNMMALLARVIEGSELEKRISALEDRSY